MSRVCVMCVLASSSSAVDHSCSGSLLVDDIAFLSLKQMMFCLAPRVVSTMRSKLLPSLLQCVSACSYSWFDILVN